MPRLCNISRIVSGLIAASLIVVLAVPALAVAAAPPAIWIGGTVSLADIGGGKEPTYVVRLALKEDVKLPASVSVPIPVGSSLIWAGEVMGEDTSNDISATDARIVTEGETASVVFTVTRSHVVQVELAPPADMVDEKAATVDLTWTPDTAVGRMLLGVVVPAGYRGVAESELTTVVPVAEGASSYVREYTSMKAGERGSLKLAIASNAPGTSGQSAADTNALAATAPAASEVDSAAGSGPEQVALIVALIVFAVLVAGVMLFYRKRGSKPTE